METGPSWVTLWDGGACMRVNTTPQETLSQPLHRGHLSAEPSAPANTPFQHLGQRPLPQGSTQCGAWELVP